MLLTQRGDSRSNCGESGCESLKPLKPTSAERRSGLARSERLEARLQHFSAGVGGTQTKGAASQRGGNLGGCTGIFLPYTNSSLLGLVIGGTRIPIKDCEHPSFRI